MALDAPDRTDLLAGLDLDLIGLNCCRFDINFKNP